jgi:catalase
MPEKDADTYRYDVTDITKIWPHGDYPLIPIGKLTLNRNPANYFAEVEQVAFAPSNVVPGIEFSMDRILQARVFSYWDTQRHRLGPNFEQIPVNCPINGIHNYQRDAFMNVTSNGGNAVNYEPNSFGGPVEDKQYAMKTFPVSGTVARRPFEQTGDIDMEQPRALWSKVMKDWHRQHLVDNMVKSMAKCKPDIKERMVQLTTNVHPDFGAAIAKGLGLPTTSPKL